jgi:hypothetical protein
MSVRNVARVAGNYGDSHGATDFGAFADADGQGTPDDGADAGDEDGAQSRLAGELDGFDLLEPAFARQLMASMSTMALFTTMPASMMRPMSATELMVVPVM